MCHILTQVKFILTTMKSIRTIRCPIEVLDTDRPVVESLFHKYAGACTQIAAFGKEKHEANSFRLHHDLYYKIRLEHGLSSNLTVTALRRAAGALKTADFKGRFQFKPTFVCLDARTFTLKLAKGVVSFSTHVKRVTAALDIGPYQHEALWGADLAQSATLVKSKSGYWINITVESDIEDAPSGGVLGVDLGIRNIATTSSGILKPGDALSKYRATRGRIRASLQSKGTKGAKRALKRLSGREFRHVSWVNHNLAKEIVLEAVKNQCSLIRMENLKGIRGRTKVWNPHRNRQMANWSYGQLQDFVEYKAAMKGIRVEKINPAYTSQTCHRCLNLGIRNGPSFACTSCGVTMDADLNAALVIAAGGAAVNRPKSNGQAHKAS